MIVWQSTSVFRPKVPFRPLLGHTSRCGRARVATYGTSRVRSVVHRKAVGFAWVVGLGSGNLRSTRLVGVVSYQAGTIHSVH